MSSTIEQLLAEAMDGQRASHPFNTKDAARTLQVHENRVGDWANRTEAKLTALARTQPRAVAVFCLRILAKSYGSDPPP